MSLKKHYTLNEGVAVVATDSGVFSVLVDVVDVMLMNEKITILYGDNDKVSFNMFEVTYLQNENDVLISKPYFNGLHIEEGLPAFMNTEKEGEA